MVWCGVVWWMNVTPALREPLHVGGGGPRGVARAVDLRAGAAESVAGTVGGSQQGLPPDCYTPFLVHMVHV